MKLYVTIEEARRQVNVPDGYEDDELTALIEAVQEQVQDDLQAPLSDYENSEGQLKKNIWHAIRIQLATYYANKESVSFATANPVPYTYDAIIRKNRKVK